MVSLQNCILISPNFLSETTSLTCASTCTNMYVLEEQTSYTTDTHIMHQLHLWYMHALCKWKAHGYMYVPCPPAPPPHWMHGGQTKLPWPLWVAAGNTSSARGHTSWGVTNCTACFGEYWHDWWHPFLQYHGMRLVPTAWTTYMQNSIRGGLSVDTFRAFSECEVYILSTGECVMTTYIHDSAYWV